jgi:hypothetical protein
MRQGTQMKRGQGILNGRIDLRGACIYGRAILELIIKRNVATV